ncbi:MAG: biotin carboxyl carrier protein [Gammaproteobacteria bacterium]|nr:biotin carboxyl carrier protein [Gammaproteobacteria bacterium]MDH4255936.1 biotin carboxyl carrier protein [Gammaproteobacteria bacterium]MDH5311178.1 biotin carboxyl carrier protein [Gammaproteobacteria bacterium]
MADIKLVDVSIRDGNQSLWGATGLNTAQMLAIAPVMNRVGFRAIDFNSSTHMGIAVRSFREDPWLLIRLMHEACPDVPLQFIGTGFRFISWETAGPDFMRLVYRRLMANGIGRFIVLDPMHDMDAVLRTARIIREEGDAEVMAALTYTLSEVHDDEFYAGIAAKVSQSPDVDLAYLKDPSGLLTPERARTLLPAIRQAMNGKPLELHSHCTIGLGPLNYMVAAELGIDALHTGAGALGNGTSLPSAQRTVANLRELGHTVDIDDEALEEVCRYFDRLADAEGLPKGAPREYDASFLRHQIPGGVMTTLRRQLEELKLGSRLPEVIDEVTQVRAELGYPIMVTPFPQIVCAQAMFNVVAKERYASIPDQVIRYALGRFGRPTGEIDPNIRDRILAQKRTRTIRAESPVFSLEEMRRKHPGVSDDDEFLLRSVMPEEQVNAMLKNDQTIRAYNPDSRPLLKLLQGLRDRPARSSIVVSKPGFRLELRAKSEAVSGGG